MLFKNRNLLYVSSLVLNLFASKIVEFFLPHPVYFTFLERAQSISYGFTLLKNTRLDITLSRSQRSIVTRSGVLILKNDATFTLTAGTV